MAKTTYGQTIPFNIVGSSSFGRYPKISLEKTYNMIISDNWQVPFAGHEKVGRLESIGEGRAIYSSSKFNHMIAVIDNGVFSIDSSLDISKIANIGTYTGDVFIDENNANQIAICDKSSIYIYNYVTGSFSKAALDFIPGYVCFQNTYFISPDLSSARWRLSNNSDGLTWPVINTGAFQSKADTPVATVRVPGKGNLILVMGSTVTQLWYNVPSQLFPYQLNTFSNIDFGCVNSATIASNEKMVVWLGINEKSGPTIMYCSGADAKPVATDGINFLLGSLPNYKDSYAFMFKQDGHIIYQLTFYTDNVTIIYDFTTGKFFHLSDEYMNAHIARQVAYFNGQYYFVSFTDGSLYRFSSDITTYNGVTIPRIRTTAPIRFPDTGRFILNKINFPIEQGVSNSLQFIYDSVSKNGGQSFSNERRTELNQQGLGAGIVNFRDYGLGNDFTLQFKFLGKGRFLFGNGEASYWQ
jgi:hypothetical protein